MTSDKPHYGKVAESVADLKLHPYALALYTQIVVRINRASNRLEMSIAQLAEMCVMNRDSVIRYTAKLEAAKLISVQRSKSGRRSDVNVYSLIGTGAGVALYNGDQSPKSTPTSRPNRHLPVAQIDGKDSLKEKNQTIDKDTDSLSQTGELALALEGRDSSVEKQDAFASELQGNAPRPAVAPTDGPTVSATPQTDTLTTVKVSPAAAAQPDWWGAAWGQLELQYPLLKAECLPFLKLVDVDVGAMRFVFEAANRRAYELVVRNEASFRRVVATIGRLRFEGVQVEVRETAPAAAGTRRFGQMEMRR